jgi:hypothetical protein
MSRRNMIKCEFPIGDPHDYGTTIKNDPISAVSGAVSIASGVNGLMGGDSSQQGVGNVAGGSIYDPYASYRGQAAQTLQALLYGGSIGGSSGFTPLSYDQWAQQQPSSGYVTDPNWTPSMADWTSHGRMPIHADTSQAAYQQYLATHPASSGSGGMSPTDLIKTMPGYQFGMSSGIEALQRGFASQGQGLGGNAAIALSDFGNKYAGDYYNQMVDRLTNLSGATMNMQSVVGQNQTNATNSNSNWSAVQQGIGAVGSAFNYSGNSNGYTALPSYVAADSQAMAFMGE